MSSDLANQLLNIFLSSELQLCSFSNTVPLKNLKNTIKKLCKLDPEYYSLLLEKYLKKKSDDIYYHIHTIYDVLSASINGYFTLVFSNFTRESKEEWSNIKSVESPVYENSTNYTIIFIDKNNNNTSSWNGHNIETVQTLPGNFLFLNCPWYSKLPGIVVKNFLNHAYLYPVLSTDSSRMKLSPVWESYCKKYDNIPKKLFSFTKLIMENIYYQEIELKNYCKNTSNFPFTDSKCEAICMISWLGVKKCVKNRGDLFLENLTQEIKNIL